jgi:hypothetical protein
VADKGEEDAEGETATPKAPETAKADTKATSNESGPSARDAEAAPEVSTAAADAPTQAQTPAGAAETPAADPDARTRDLTPAKADDATEGRTPATEADDATEALTPAAKADRPTTEADDPTRDLTSVEADDATEALTPATKADPPTTEADDPTPAAAAEAPTADVKNAATEADPPASKAGSPTGEPEPPAAPPPGKAGAEPAAESPTAPDRTPAKRDEPAGEIEDAGAEVASALRRLRSAIVGSAYPLVLASAEDARRVSAALLAQLDDYLLPRLARLDAPLLVVVGGSTGAGKSTLVNSFVRAPVSPSGVLRPTTRTPVLVCNPADTQWFRRGDLLPGLTRTAEATADPNSLQIVAAPALAPGLAFLDAPDIDSVVDANRALAAQLLAAADLWLFVTTAARYADAVPWELLQTARFRGTVTALVLDRVPPEATEEVTAHLLEMLSIHGLDMAPLFVLPETEVDRQGLLPEAVTAPLREWFGRIAADAATRAAVVRQTLDGALAALVPAVEGLAAAADEQVTTADALDDRVRAAYRAGRRTISQGVQDGRLLRGEVLARWQEFVGTGELLRTLEARVGRLRDRVIAAFTGRPQPGRELKSAIEANLVTLIRGAAADAAESAYTGWQAHPAGAALLEPSLGRSSPDLPERAERLVRDWQRGVLELIRREAGHKRATARGAAYAVNATGLLVMVGVFASTAFIPTGAEVAVAGGTTVAAQKVLEAIFGDQAIRTLAAKARDDLISRTNALLDTEAARYTDRLIAAGISADPGKDLRDAAALVEYTRRKAELTSGTGLALPGVDS